MYSLYSIIICTIIICTIIVCSIIMCTIIINYIQFDIITTNIIPDEDVVDDVPVVESLVDGTDDDGDDDDDDDEDPTMKLLLVRVIPIVIKEFISSDTTCRSYVRTAFGCKSVNENIPVVLVTYDTRDGLMEGMFIFNSTIKSSSRTRSAVVYSITADVLVSSVTSSSLSQEAT